jgi:glutamate carboxypeptidase
LLGHYDTVWDLGTLGRCPLRRAGAVESAAVAFDMKAGLALGMLALRAIADTASAWPGRVTFLITSDEETGAATSRQVIEDEALRSEAVLVLEPSLPGGALKTSRKGCGEFVLRVEGVPAHAGIEPEKGASAIHELARQVIAIQGVQDVARGTTLNVGKIAGGRACRHDGRGGAGGGRDGRVAAPRSAHAPVGDGRPGQAADGAHAGHRRAVPDRASGGWGPGPTAG